MWNESTCRQVKALYRQRSRSVTFWFNKTTSRWRDLDDFRREVSVYVAASAVCGMGPLGHVDNTVSHLNSDRVSVPSIEGPARYARGSWTERFAISTTIRALRLPRNQRDSYIDDLGKTDVYLGQRDRRWNAASRGYSSRISWAGFRGGDFVSWLNRRLIRPPRCESIRKEIARMIFYNGFLLQRPRKIVIEIVRVWEQYPSIIRENYRIIFTNSLSHIRTYCLPTHPLSTSTVKKVAN